MMRQRQAEHDAASGRVPIRAALPGKEGEDDETIGTGGHGGGPAADLVGAKCRVTGLGLAGRWRRREHLIAQPAYCQPSVIDRTAGNPAVLGQVVAPVPSLRVGHGLVRDGTHGAAGRDHRGILPRLDATGAQRGEGAVPGAGDDGAARRQPQPLGSRGREGADDRGGVHERGEPLRADACRL